MGDSKESPTINENALVKYNRDGTRCKLVKRSKIWDKFRIAPGESSKAVCNECNGVISRGGGTGRSQCTTNLWKHLENKHHDLFVETSKYKEVVNRAEKVQRHPENSKAWELFSVDVGDPVLVKCLECNVKIIRPDDNVTTDVLWYHIMTEHPMLYGKCVNEALESAVLHRKGKRSTVWSEFTQHPSDPCKVICNTCDTLVSRGTSKDKLNTTNMRRHLIGNVHLVVAKSKGLGLELSEITANTERFVGANEEPKRRKVSTPDKECYSAARSTITVDQNKNINQTAQALLTNRSVDLLHTGLLGYGLYEQQKRGDCCDFSIVIPRTSEMPEVDKIDRGNDEVKIHSCIASLVSEKLREAVENRQDRLELTNVSKRIVQYFVEIVYTGKLGLTNSIDTFEAQELRKLARYLEVDTVCDFIERIHPDTPLPLSCPQDTNPHDAGVSMTTSPYIDVETLRLPPEACEILPKINKRKNYIPISNVSASASETVTGLG